MLALCILSRRMPLRTSPCLFSPAHASLKFTAYLLCACLPAFHCLPSLRVRGVPPCPRETLFFIVPAGDSSADWTPVANSPCQSLYAVHSAYLPCACLSEVHCCTCPAHASMQFTVVFPCALHSALAPCMPLHFIVCLHTSMPYTARFL